MSQTPEVTKPFCCHMECDNDAEFEIHGQAAVVDDMTHACEQHVGALLGTPNDGLEDNKAWTVVQL